MPVIQLMLSDDLDQIVFILDIVDTFELSGVSTISLSDTPDVMAFLRSPISLVKRVTRVQSIKMSDVVRLALIGYTARVDIPESRLCMIMDQRPFEEDFGMVC